MYAAWICVMLVCQQVLYTGDFSCVEDRHLMAAEAPPIIPDILISVRSLCLCLFLSYASNALLSGGDIWNTRSWTERSQRSKIHMWVYLEQSLNHCVCSSDISTYYLHYKYTCWSPPARVHDIVTRGGHCLIPVFALGRAQELLLILDEYWAAHPELHDIPIYYASSLAKKCMAGNWDCWYMLE